MRAATNRALRIMNAVHKGSKCTEFGVGGLEFRVVVIIQPFPDSIRFLNSKSSSFEMFYRLL